MVDLAHSAPIVAGAGENNVTSAFISYARDDTERVNAIEAQLHAAGVPTWRDQDQIG